MKNSNEAYMTEKNRKRVDLKILGMTYKSRQLAKTCSRLLPIIPH